MEALSKQPVIIVIEVDLFCYRLNTNRAAQKDEFEGEHTESADQESLDRSIAYSCGSSLSSFEYHCWTFKIDHNRTYMSYRLAFVVAVSLPLESSSCDAAISCELDFIDDSVFDVHDVLLSLLQGEVSLKMSVVVKSISDLFSEALPDESSEDEVLLLQTVTCQNGQMQRTVEDVGGVESVNNARQLILTDLMFECGLTFTVEPRKAERACVNMTSILIC